MALRKVDLEIYESLKGKESLSAKEIAATIGISDGKVRSSIARLRRAYLDSNDQVENYPVLTKNGYSLKGSRENLLYEAGFRIRLGFGVLSNGRYVFKRCKLIGGQKFAELRGEFKPKLLDLNRVIDV